MSAETAPVTQDSRQIQPESHTSHESHDSQALEPPATCLRCWSIINPADLADSARLCWDCRERCREAYIGSPPSVAAMRARYSALFESHANGKLPAEWQLRGKMYDTAATMRAACTVRSVTSVEFLSVLRDLYYLSEWLQHESERGAEEL